MNGQPKPGFYFVVLLVILSLVGYGLYRLKTPTSDGTPPVTVDASQQGDNGDPTTPPAGDAAPRRPMRPASPRSRNTPTSPASGCRT